MPQLFLHCEHEAMGAQFASEGEWTLPAHYGDPLSEYQTARHAVGIADLSHHGNLLIAGEDRTSFLQNLISNDVHLATSHQGIFSALLTAKGKTLSVFHLYALSDAYLMTMESVLAEKTAAHLARFRFRSKVTISTPRWGKLLLIGPQARPLLTSLLGVSPPPQSFLVQERDPQLCIQQTETESILYCREENLPAFYRTLLEAGSSLTIAPVGQAALEIIRIENGRPRYGAEMDETVIPVETGLADTVISYTKGCYPGQEVIARIKTYGHVNKHLMGLALSGVALPQSGDRVFNDQEEVGRVTSSVYSPFLKRPIALAYLKTAVAHAGQAVSVRIDETLTPAQVTTLPFYKKEP
jgi:folate-binding protein YgfZ